MPKRQDASLQLAQLWVEMQTVERQINAVILPLMQHLDFATEDELLTTAMVECALHVGQHFERFKLQASRTSE